MSDDKKKLVVITPTCPLETYLHKGYEWFQTTSDSVIMCGHHQYVCNDKNIWPPLQRLWCVSNIKADLFPVFDAQAIAERKVARDRYFTGGYDDYDDDSDDDDDDFEFNNYYCGGRYSNYSRKHRAVEKLLAEWEEMAQESIVAAQIFKNYMTYGELPIKTENSPRLMLAMNAFKKFYQHVHTNLGWRLFVVDMPIIDRTRPVCGTIHALFVHHDDVSEENSINSPQKVILCQWKLVSSDLADDPYWKVKKANGPLKNLMDDTKLNQCVVQLSFYKYILENPINCYNCQVDEICIIQFTRDTEDYRIIPIETLDASTVEACLDYVVPKVVKQPIVVKKEPASDNGGKKSYKRVKRELLD